MQSSKIAAYEEIGSKECSADYPQDGKHAPAQSQTATQRLLSAMRSLRGHFMAYRLPASRGKKVWRKERLATYHQILQEAAGQKHTAPVGQAAVYQTILSVHETLSRSGYEELPQGSIYTQVD